MMMASTQSPVSGSSLLPTTEDISLNQPQSASVSHNQPQSASITRLRVEQVQSMIHDCAITSSDGAHGGYTLLLHLPMTVRPLRMLILLI